MIVSLGGLSGCTKGQEGVSLGPAKPAPAFELKDPSGTVHRLEQFKGQFVLVHFWASWCPPCKDEIPLWLTAARMLQAMPVKLVAITVDEKLENALTLLPAQGLPPNMISLWDPASSVSAKYGTTQFPETYLVSPDGRIVEKWIGPQDWTSSRIRFALIQAIAKARKAGVLVQASARP